MVLAKSVTFDQSITLMRQGLIFSLKQHVASRQVNSSALIMGQSIGRLRELLLQKCKSAKIQSYLSSMTIFRCSDCIGSIKKREK
jgi:hypothetical protein